MMAVSLEKSIFDLVDDDVLRGDVLSAHTAASMALEELRAVSLDVVDEVQNAMLVREASASCLIEGIRVLGDDELLGSVCAGPEVSGCCTGMRVALSSRISIGLIEEVCSDVLGRPVRIRGPGEQVYLVDRAGDIVHTPPEGGYVGTLMEGLIDYLEDDGIDPLVRMACGHLMFEAVHPFMDGNGRTGRIVNCTVLHHAGLVLSPVLCMSEQLLRERRDYYREIRRFEDGRGSWERWMLLMLGCVRESAVVASERIRRMMDRASYGGGPASVRAGRPPGSSHLPRLEKPPVQGVERGAPQD